MTLFYILLLILLIGFGAIAWVLMTEKKKELPEPQITKTTESQLSPKELLSRLGIENPKLDQSKPSLTDHLNKPAFSSSLSGKQDADIASLLKIAPTTKAIEKESELSLKYDELLTQHNEQKTQYAKLETLFKEKSAGLEKSEKSLTNELKNQKDFNKIKDILEKEIKDAKEKISSLQSDVLTAQTETQTQLKRVSQLEEKVKKLEIDVLTSEAAINDANALTQLARKHSAELEDKLHTLENQILDKNHKIEDLVSRLKDLPPATNVVEKGGAQKDENLPLLPLETSGEKPKNPLIDEKTILKTIAPPEVLQKIEQKPSENAIIEKTPDGALTLPPDILQKTTQTEPKQIP